MKKYLTYIVYIANIFFIERNIIIVIFTIASRFYKMVLTGAREGK